MLWFAHRPPPAPHPKFCQERCCLSDTFLFLEAISGDGAFKTGPWGSWFETQPSQQFLDYR